MENLAVKRSALKSLIKELALMDDEEPKGSINLKGSAVDKLEGSDPKVSQEEPSVDKSNEGAKLMEEAGEALTNHESKEEPAVTISKVKQMEVEDMSLEDLKKIKKMLADKGIL